MYFKTIAGLVSVKIRVDIFRDKCSLQKFHSKIKKKNENYATLKSGLICDFYRTAYVYTLLMQITV